MGERILPVDARACGAMIAEKIQLHPVELLGQLVRAGQMSIGVGEKCSGGPLGNPVLHNPCPHRGPAQ